MKRRKTMPLLVAALLGTGLIAGQAAEKTTEVKKQTNCPVMGGKINKAQFADVNGKRIYTCCPGCIGKIKADPEKYIRQMEAEGITLDKVGTMKMDAKGHMKHDHGDQHH